MGSLQLEQGASTVFAFDQIATVSFDRLLRHGASSIDFVTSTSNAATRLLFDEVPATPNGIIGAWATYRGDDFAAYDATLGVVALGNRVARPSQIDTAGPSDHVRTLQAIAPLTANRTIHSLLLTSTADVNLGGHTLAIVGGGIISDGNGQDILNGRLTAGNGDGPADLYLHGNISTVSAAIVDNSITSPLTLVKTSSSNVTLSGTNTYSGSTIIQEGTLTFTSEQALPTSSALVVDGGVADFQYQPSAPKKLSQLARKATWLRYGPTDFWHATNHDHD